MHGDIHLTIYFVGPVFYVHAYSHAIIFTKIIFTQDFVVNLHDCGHASYPFNADFAPRLNNFMIDFQKLTKHVDLQSLCITKVFC